MEEGRATPTKRLTQSLHDGEVREIDRVQASGASRSIFIQRAVWSPS